MEISEWRPLSERLSSCLGEVCSLGFGCSRDLNGWDVSGCSCVPGAC